MRSLRSELPPPNALVTFEAAARLLSFTAAAIELSVTQAAVSRQIHILESSLGIDLFQRSPRGVNLTEQGRAYYETVSMALRHIAAKSTETRHLANPKHVTISATSGIATCWLMPRLSKFQESSSGVDIRLLTSEPPIMPGTEGVDLTIRYGDGSWPGVHAFKLFDDEIFPVCSPGYLSKCPKLEKPADLLNQTLLHRDALYSHKVGNWDDWLREVGVDVSDPLPGPRFNNYAIGLQAAIEGRGIAMGWGRLVQTMLDANLLVRPVKASVKTTDAYYLIVSDPNRLNRAATLLREWVLKEAGARTKQK